MAAPSSPAAPPCRAMGPQCTSLPVLLRVATLDAGADSADHEATWLLGHTERITFLGDLRRDGRELFTEAVLHVPCRFLGQDSDGRGHCLAHGFHSSTRSRLPDPAEPRQFGKDRFRIVESGRAITRTLPLPAPPPRELPVLAEANPCATAPCRTADNRRGAACCRDLQIEIMCTPRQRLLEALIRARKPPYLCKVEREGAFSLGAEMISACGFLLTDGVLCSLHGRTRADGRPAKPDLCSRWPEPGDTRHTGCVFGPQGIASHPEPGDVQGPGPTDVLKSGRYAAARR